MAKVYPELKSSTVIKRHPNPVLTMKDIPYKATCIYNAGVTIYRGQYVMIFRNDVRESYGSVPIDYIDLERSSNRMAGEEKSPC